jgi:dTDP-4-dehydrorhamnose 3,5-epimerase
VKFTPTPLAGAFVVELEPQHDERGFFARFFCSREFASHGLETRINQCNLSFNAHAGTLRGLHFQARTDPEAKLVHCVQGALFDVIVDLRRQSPTFLRWFSAELSAENRKSLYVPAGFAHGFQTLAAGTEILYLMSAPYRAEASRGVRWDDEAIAIRWPLAPQHMSSRDLGLPISSALDPCEFF